MYFFLEGLQGTTASDAAILLSTAPLWTTLFEVVSKQTKPSLGSIAGALLGLIGVALVVYASGSKSHGQFSGNLFVLISAMLWALSAIVSKPLLSDSTPIRTLTLSLPGALPVLVPYAITDVMATKWHMLTPLSWGMFAHVTVMAGIVGFVGFYSGVKQIGSGAAMLYQYFVPPIAAFSAFLALGTPFLPLQGIGFAIIVFGVAWATKARALNST